MNDSFPHHACEFNGMRKRGMRARSLRFLALRKICFHWLHLDTFLSRSEPSHFRTQMHLPETMTDLLPDGFIWIPFCPDLNRATFEPRCTFPKLWPICFQMASFGHRSVQISLKQFSKPCTPIKKNVFRSTGVEREHV